MKRLCKSATDRKVAGVCGGIDKYTAPLRTIILSVKPDIAVGYFADLQALHGNLGTVAVIFKRKGCSSAAEYTNTGNGNDNAEHAVKNLCKSLNQVNSVLPINPIIYYKKILKDCQ